MGHIFFLYAYCTTLFSSPWFTWLGWGVFLICPWSLPLRATEKNPTVRGYKISFGLLSLQMWIWLLDPCSGSIWFLSLIQKFSLVFQIFLFWNICILGVGWDPSINAWKSWPHVGYCPFPPRIFQLEICGQELILAKKQPPIGRYTQCEWSLQPDPYHHPLEGCLLGFKPPPPF